MKREPPRRQEVFFSLLPSGDLLWLALGVGGPRVPALNSVGRVCRDAPLFLRQQLLKSGALQRTLPTPCQDGPAISPSWEGAWGECQHCMQRAPTPRGCSSVKQGSSGTFRTLIANRPLCVPMYKFVLCLRYLRTRWIALISIVSVTLGVATMIVVNAVMAGFSHEMQDRLHGVLSDVVFESQSLDGAVDAEKHMAEIREAAGDLIEGMSPTALVPAMLGFTINGHRINKPITMIGIDPATYGQVSDFGKYLQHPSNREALDFNLREGGYDVIDHQAEDPSLAMPRTQMEYAGWEYRRRKAYWEKEMARVTTEASQADETLDKLTDKETEVAATPPANPFAQHGELEEGKVFDAMTEQHPGIVVGIALGSYRTADGEDQFQILPGDDIEVTYPMATTPPKPGSSFFTVVDFYESKMSEYDASFVFVPLDRLQEMRRMVDPMTKVANFNAIQIRCKEGVDPDVVRDKIQSAFDPRMFVVSTWRDKQGAILAAVEMETAVLNVLLFMIIAVAGFGILAIFYMIVVEKTRDIGILKSLGASRSGIMGIFLSYGLALGVVGAGAGMVSGLLFVDHINEIADLLGWLTGRPIFDPSVYYFQKIPTIIYSFTIAWIVLGAMAIAILASVLPAYRASRMHPVAALRWD